MKTDELMDNHDFTPERLDLSMVPRSLLKPDALQAEAGKAPWFLGEEAGLLPLPVDLMEQGYKPSHQGEP